MTSHRTAALAAAFALGLLATSAAQPLTTASFTDADALGALKETLTQGAGTAVGKLGIVDGFLGNTQVRIGLPDKLAKRAKWMRWAGFGDELDALTTTMNRAAEAAVPEAKDLLLEAVKDMSVADAQQILTGGDDSVTQYFRSATQDRLRERFLPIVREKTDTLGLAGQYNKLAGAASRYGLLSAEEARLEDYVTGKALDGLYFMIAQEERAIRKDPLGQASDLLKRVFGAIGK